MLRTSFCTWRLKDLELFAVEEAGQCVLHVVSKESWSTYQVAIRVEWGTLLAPIHLLEPARETSLTSLSQTVPLMLSLQALQEPFSVYDFQKVGLRNVNMCIHTFTFWSQWGQLERVGVYNHLCLGDWSWLDFRYEPSLNCNSGSLLKLPIQWLLVNNDISHIYCQLL